MLNHLKFTIRVFRRDKFYALLNILGLSVGLGVGIWVLMILRNDLTYDSHYSQHERICRLSSHYQIKGVDEWVGRVARELGPIIHEQYPELEEVLPVQPMQRVAIRIQKESESVPFVEDQVIQTNDRYFNVFSHQFIAGNPETCLRSPNAVVLTQSLARKYFGEADPLEQTIWIDGSWWKVTAIIGDVKENSHLKFGMVLSGLRDYRTWSLRNNVPVSEAFWNPDIYLYLKVPKGYLAGDFYEKWPAIYKRYFKETGDQMAGSNTPFLQELSEIHLDTEIQDSEAHGSMSGLYTLIAVGLLILVLACINYMNLSTARAMQRVDEIMIRKALGSTRRQIIFSFVAESVLMTFTAWTVAVIIVVTLITQPAISDWTGRNLTIHLFANTEVLFGSMALAFIVGGCAGLYPAFYCTGLSATVPQKGSGRGLGGLYVKRTFMVIQFSISVFVVLCTIYMRQQLDFVQSRDLGFSTQNLVVLPISDSVVFNKLEVIKASLLQSPRIESVTASQDIPGRGVGSGVVYGESDTGMKEEGGVLCLFVGDDYLRTMGIELIAGRDFLPGEADLKGKYIANESAVKRMGWTTPIGKKVQLWGGANAGEVIGVVKDFNVNSLYQGIDPMVIMKGHWNTGYLQIRIHDDSLAKVTDEIKQKWNELFPDHYFEYFFLDQRFNAQYHEDVVQARVLSALSMICVAISLLGIVGLSAFTAARRTKEMGIRKVMGARSGDIILLLAGDTIVLLVVSVIMVIPASLWAVSTWLQHFAYRMDVDWIPCLFVVLAAMALVLLTIAAQSYRMVTMSPTHALRHE